MAVLYSDTGVPIKSTNPLPVTLYGPTGAVITHAEDAVHQTGDAGIMPLAVQDSDTVPGALAAAGKYAPFQVDSAGRLFVNGTVFDSAGNAIPSSTGAGDGLSATNRGLFVAAYGLQLNPSGDWDRVRNNAEATALAFAARTAEANSGNITNYNHRGIIVYLDVTVASGTGGLQIKIESIDPTTNNRHQLNVTPTAITAVARHSYELSPGGSTAAPGGTGNLTQRTAGSLPRTFRITVSVGDASSYTYSVGYHLIG